MSSRKALKLAVVQRRSVNGLTRSWPSIRIGKIFPRVDAYEHTSRPLRPMPGIVFLDAGG